jgi:hypothetical protein
MANGTTATGKKKRGRGNLAEYAVPEGGLTSLPTDWKRDKHKKLHEDSFKDSDLWYGWRQKLVDDAIGIHQARIAELESEKAAIVAEKERYAAMPAASREAIRRVNAGAKSIERGLKALLADESLGAELLGNLSSEVVEKLNALLSSTIKDS